MFHDGFQGSIVDRIKFCFTWTEELTVCSISQNCISKNDPNSFYDLIERNFEATVRWGFFSLSTLMNKMYIVIVFADVREEEMPTQSESDADDSQEISEVIIKDFIVSGWILDVYHITRQEELNWGATYSKEETFLLQLHLHWKELLIIIISASFRGWFDKNCYYKRVPHD